MNYKNALDEPKHRRSVEFKRGREIFVTFDKLNVAEAKYMLRHHEKTDSAAR